MEIFRIRSTKTGLFSKGGKWPRFGKKGKIWRRKGDLSSHLTQLGQQGREQYAECEIIRYEVLEEEGVKIPAADWLMVADERKEKKLIDYQESVRQWKERQEKAQLAALKAKYERV